MTRRDVSREEGGGGDGKKKACRSVACAWYGMREGRKERYILIDQCDRIGRVDARAFYLSVGHTKLASSLYKAEQRTSPFLSSPPPSTFHEAGLAQSLNWASALLCICRGIVKFLYPY